MSFSGRSQQASSNTVSYLSNATLIAKELASTHTFSSRPSTHQSPWAGSSCCTESTVSDIIRCSKLSLVSSFQPFVIELTLLLSTLQITLSQPHTEKCPTSFPHKENTACHMTISGASGTMLPCFHRNLPCSITTCQPQHLCTIFQSFLVLILKFKSNLVFSNAGCGHNIFVDTKTPRAAVKIAIRTCEECQSIGPAPVHWEKGTLKVGNNWQRVGMNITHYGAHHFLTLIDCGRHVSQFGGNWQDKTLQVCFANWRFLTDRMNELTRGILRKGC